MFAICLELQGHATKNQDLLLASGTISLKGSDGLNAVDDDIMAAVSFVTPIILPAVSDHLLSKPSLDLTFIAVFDFHRPPSRSRILVLNLNL